MSEYTQPPNENWVAKNCGEKLLLKYPNERFIVTIQRAVGEETDE